MLRWAFGETEINLLVLAVVRSGTAVPLLWRSLNKKGNSDTAERIELMMRFIQLFGMRQIAYLTADREFVGEEWLSWLLDEGTPVNLRIKKNTSLYGEQIWKIFTGLPMGTKKRLTDVSIWGCRVNVEGMRLKEGHYVIILATTRRGIIKAYKSRWNIETLFGNLKKRGFRFEDTHLTKVERISKLLA